MLQLELEPISQVPDLVWRAHLSNASAELELFSNALSKINKKSESNSECQLGCSRQLGMHRAG